MKKIFSHPVRFDNTSLRDGDDTRNNFIRISRKFSKNNNTKNSKFEHGNLLNESLDQEKHVFRGRGGLRILENMDKNQEHLSLGRRLLDVIKKIKSVQF